MNGTFINMPSSKKTYQKPQILQELALETRAGVTPILPTDETGLAPIFIAPGVFTIDSDEP